MGTSTFLASKALIYCLLVNFLSNRYNSLPFLLFTMGHRLKQRFYPLL